MNCQTTQISTSGCSTQHFAISSFSAIADFLFYMSSTDLQWQAPSHNLLVVHRNNHLSCTVKRSSMGQCRFTDRNQTTAEAARPWTCSWCHIVACLFPSFCQYQFILLGNSGTWVWRTCPEVFPGRESNSQPFDLESKTLPSTITPPSHPLTLYKKLIAGILKNWPQAKTDCSRSLQGCWPQ